MLKSVQNLLLALSFVPMLSCAAAILSAEPSPDAQNKQASSYRPAQEPDQKQNPKFTWERLWDRTLDEPVAFYTFVLAVFTGVLSTVSITQIFFLIRADKTTRIAAEATKESAKAARDNADAAISASAPFLHPRVHRFDLYPEGVVSDDAKHNPLIWIAFENIGHTPAILRSIGAKLSLIDNERQLPEPEPLENIGSVERSDAIAAGNLGGIREWPFRAIDATEIRRLQAKSEDPTHLRFYVFGFVVYEDVFNVRTTRRFCLKVRPPKFSAVRGGERHNTIRREKNPQGEAIGVPPEDI